MAGHSSKPSGGQPDDSPQTMIPSLNPIEPQDASLAKYSGEGPFETALLLAGLGYFVGRVRPNSKAPVGGERAATRDAGTIRKWWTAQPDAGVFVNLHQSGLVDVAPDNEEWLGQFKEWGLPPPTSFQSAGGPGHEHHFYRLPVGTPVRSLVVPQEYDLKSQGIAVVPPTRLGERAYVWLTKPVQRDLLLEAPAWVVNELCREQDTEPGEEVVDPSEPPVPLTGDGLAYWQGTKRKFNDRGEQDRSDTLVEIANALARGGMSAYGINLALRDRALMLGLDKYEGRSDEDKRYAQLARSAVRQFGRVDPSVGEALFGSGPTGYAETPAGQTLADLLTSGDKLLLQTFRDPRWAIEGLIPEGLSMLVGKPKMGKSWLALDAVSGIATGRTVLGKDPTRGPTLYIALEDNLRRLQERLAMVLSSDVDLSGGGDGFFGIDLSSLPDPELLDVATRWPRLDQGGMQLLDEWLTLHSDARLVVIDPWSRIKPKAGRGSAYDEDYTALGPLQGLAMKHNVAILVVHHMRKQETDDPLDAINGSMGLAGVLDAALILKRERSRADAHLYLTGRDIREDGDVPMSWDNSTTRWTLSGDAQEARMSSERAEVYNVVKEAGVPIKGRAVAELVEKKEATVRRLLAALVKDQLLVNSSNGYTVPDPSHTSQASHTSQPSHDRERGTISPGRGGQ